MGLGKVLRASEGLFNKKDDVAVAATLQRQPVIAVAAPDRPLSAKVLELEFQVRQLLGEPHLYDRFFKPIAQEFYKTCWGFPASDGHHHPGRFGLIEHSLGVCVRMLRDAPAVRAGLIGSEKERFVLHCALAGLGHDLGKTMEWVVDSRGYDYSPMFNSMRDQHYAPVSHYNTGMHEYLSVGVFTRLLLACPAYFSSKAHDVAQLALVYEAIAKHHEPASENEAVDNPYLSLLRKADAEDAAEDLVVIPEDAEITLREEEIVRAREEARLRMAEIATRAIRLVISEAEYGFGWYLTDNGWLCLVSPRWIDYPGQGVHPEFTKLLGREIRPYELWSLLHSAGVMVRVEGKDFVSLRLTKGGSAKPPLTFALFAEEAILTPEETEKYERYAVKGLQGVVQKALAINPPEPKLPPVEEDPKHAASGETVEYQAVEVVQPSVEKTVTESPGESGEQPTNIEVNLPWLDPDAVLSELKKWVNVVSHNRWGAVSMPDGLIYVQGDCLFGVIRKVAGREGEAQIKEAESDPVTKASLLKDVVAVLSQQLHVIDSGNLLPDQSAANVVVLDSAGKPANSIRSLIPFKADAMGLNPADLEQSKNPELKKMVRAIKIKTSN